MLIPPPGAWCPKVTRRLVSSTSSYVDINVPHENIFSCLLATYVCGCYWSPVRVVFLNYEVVVFQPRTLTTPDLGSITYYYIAYLLNLTRPLFLPYDVLPGEEAHSCPVSPAIDMSPHRIIRSHGHHLSPSLHTKKPSPAFPLPVPSRLRFLLPSLASATPAKFPLPPNIFNVAFRCRIPPPQLPEPVSFSYTSKIGHKATHSSTVVCLFLI